MSWSKRLKIKKIPYTLEYNNHENIHKLIKRFYMLECLQFEILDYKDLYYMTKDEYKTMKRENKTEMKRIVQTLLVMERKLNIDIRWHEQMHYWDYFTIVHSTKFDEDYNDLVEECNNLLPDFCEKIKSKFVSSQFH
jgi:hypothetical protein